MERMLKRIIFVLTDPGQREKARRLGESLMRGTGEEALLRVDVEAAQSFLEKEEQNIRNNRAVRKQAGQETGRHFAGSKGEGEAGEACGESLFVTDEALVLKRLKRQGARTAALIHDGNRAQDMSGAAYAVSELDGLPLEWFEKTWRRLAGLPWTAAKTKRCILREMTVADVDAFYEIYAHPDVTRYMEPLFADPEEERSYTRDYIRQIYGFYGYGLWSVVRREDGKVIGRAGLSWREGFDLPELGFVIAVPCQRQGYAFEVCGAILACGWEELGFDTVQALVMQGNTASIGLCKKLGFTRYDRVESRGIVYERYLIHRAGRSSCP